jgi:hypothetical protein
MSVPCSGFGAGVVVEGIAFQVLNHEDRFGWGCSAWAAGWVAPQLWLFPAVPASGLHDTRKWQF